MQVVRSLGLIRLFPVTFVPSAFVSTQDMPGPLRAVADRNPVSATATAVRELFRQPLSRGAVRAASTPVVHAPPHAFASAAVVVTVFMAQAVSRCRAMAHA